MSVLREWLVVGAGFTGATVARRLAEDFDVKVLLIDQRPHLAGNAYDSREPTGELVHRYGPHIFHTNSPAVFGFLSRFTSWRSYQHRVGAMIDGTLVPLPFGFGAIDTLLPERAERLKNALSETYGIDARVPIGRLATSSDRQLQELAEFILENVFRNYSRRQWGRELDELDASVAARVPVAISYDERYFADSFQGIPSEGYTELFRRMLDHPNISVQLSTKYETLAPTQKALPTVHTGAIDDFHDFEFGMLPYRSMDFEYVHFDRPFAQPFPTINLPSSPSHIRSTEYAWLTGEANGSSVIVRESPRPHEWGKTDPHYPIPMRSTKDIADKYFNAARRLRGKLWFAGRLGDYQYYNMDQACARGHALVDKELRQVLPHARTLDTRLEI
ncbi:UDP-galactopyranose mutase [Bradyrhizobium betae]|uniref:UDP-galactopyranose mutase n=1 Tax=Bradyrhizobium betae TaxID=244734 RepID=UPI003D66BF32